MGAGKTLPVALVVAVAANQIIGADGDMPWRLSTDLKRFKAVTMGKPVIMGRKTFQSIGKALPGRLNIVVTRNDGFSAEGALRAPSLEAAIVMAEEWARENGASELCVIGGGQIYAEAMALADRLYVTHVMASPEGDTVFPNIAENEWRSTSEEAVPVGEKDNYPSLYVTYERWGV